MVTAKVDFQLGDSKRKFLYDLVQVLPELIYKTKEKMIDKQIFSLNLESLESPEDYHNALELSFSEGKDTEERKYHLDYLTGGHTRRTSNVENNMWRLYEYLSTHPDKCQHEQEYSSLNFSREDVLNSSFERGLKIHKCLTHFLAQE